MKFLASIFIFHLVFSKFSCQDPCRIDIDCEECLPEFLPLVLSHSTRNNYILIPHGDTVHLHCNQGKFIAYPNSSELEVVCKHGDFHATNDSMVLMHISELGCNIDFYEDIVHEVEFCRNPFEGRSYQYRNKTTSNVVHLTDVCFDTEQGRTVFVHMDMSNDNNIRRINHVDRENRMSLLGTFNKLFDKSNKLEAEKVYDTTSSLAKKIQYMMGKHHFNFVNHQLVVSKLLAASFYLNQNGRVSNFISNKVALWNSVAYGNFKNIHMDIVDAFKRHNLNNEKSLDVFVGTHDTLSLPVMNHYFELFLKPGKKYPVPKYVWTVLFDKKDNKSVALVLYNNPFTSISEIRNAVFCPSICNSINWINNLKFNNNFERSVYGLVFCCDIHSFAKVVGDVPSIKQNVQLGDSGVLRNGFQ